MIQYHQIGPTIPGGGWLVTYQGPGGTTEPIVGWGARGAYVTGFDGRLDLLPDSPATSYFVWHPDQHPDEIAAAMRAHFNAGGAR